MGDRVQEVIGDLVKRHYTDVVYSFAEGLVAIMRSEEIGGAFIVERPDDPIAGPADALHRIRVKTKVDPEPVLLEAFVLRTLSGLVLAAFVRQQDPVMFEKLIAEKVKLETEPRT